MTQQQRYHGGSRRRRRMMAERGQRVGFLPALPAAASVLIPSAGTLGATAAGLVGGAYAEDLKELPGDAYETVGDKFSWLPDIDGNGSQTDNTIGGSAEDTVSGALDGNEEQQGAPTPPRQQAGISAPLLVLGAGVVGIGALIALR